MGSICGESALVVHAGTLVTVVIVDTIAREVVFILL